MTPAQERPKLPPGAALALAVVAVSTGALFVRLADAPALVIAAYRCSLSTLVLVAIGWRACRAEWPRLSRAEAGLALLTGLALALHFAAWISSMAYTTVAASVVIVNTTPLWVALATPFVSKDRLRPGTLVGILVSVAGCAVIGWEHMGDITGRALVGDGLALCGAWMAAVFMLTGRRLRRTLSLVPFVTAGYGTAALLLCLAVLATGGSFTGYTPQTYGAFVALALVPQLIGHSSYNYALRYVSAALVSVATLGESIGASLLAWWFLGEVPLTPTWIGAAIVIAGVLLAVRAERAAS